MIDPAGRDGPREIDHAVVVPEEQSGSERRQHERFELTVQVALSGSEGRGMLTVLNISAGGVLLRNDDNAAFSVGELIRVEFDTPELANQFSIEAKVIRVVAPSGKSAVVAAMWTSSDAAATAGLSEVLWSLSKRR